ncbi:MAG: T9SS type A sorting domain-containing protein [Crocinitomicaceae bacterium]
MKKISIVLFSLFLSFIAKSQFVTISDVGFKNYLTFNYPSCMTGNQMDTTCPAILNALVVTISNSYAVTDINGIQYFDNLHTLDINNNFVDSLPYLPQNLINLAVANNGLTYIPNLPSSLLTLGIPWNSALNSIPALPSGLLGYERSATPSLPIETTLPPLLQSYGISYCNVINVPPFPSSLTSISLDGNVNMVMPIFPSSITWLSIGDLNLSVLPPLPNTIKYLFAFQNNFTSLTSFPSDLEILSVPSCTMLTYIANLPILTNQLTADDCILDSLGVLPNSIQSISVQNNNLTGLPNVPTSTTKLNINNNQITNLQSLPATIFELNISNNNLNCLPFLPSSLIYLSMNNNPFTCLPNILPVMNATFQAYPLCSPNDPVNNPFGCLGAEGIQGYVYVDGNSDCLFDPNDLPLKNIPIKQYDASGGFVGSTSTFWNGRYYFNTLTGQFNIIVDTINKPYEVDCVYPGADSIVNVTTASPLISNVNFGLKCGTGFDVGAMAVHAIGNVFPGQYHTLQCVAGDMSTFYNLNCANGQSGIVTINVTGLVNYFAPAAGSLTPTVSGNTFSYSIADFGAINPLIDFGLVFETDTTANSMDVVCVQVIVASTTADNNSTNDTLVYCYDVVNSYDPNNKTVYPKTVLPLYEDYLIYTVNFQNTGTAPAINIRLEDPLSSLLDYSTFEVINYSHDMYFGLNNGIVKFHFPNINLVDSSVSQANSKGFVTYKIKPIGGLTEGTTIPNKAHIYFDYNAPITTNTVFTNFQTTNSLAHLQSEKSILYPNPNDGLFSITGTSNGEEIYIYDFMGRQMDFRSSITNGTLQVEIENAQKGIYIIKLFIENTEKYIKIQVL